nr:MFS transporter [Steroidobacteraceae bacterium]
AGPLVAALVGIPAGRAVDRFSAPRMTVVGLIAMAIGCIALSLIPATYGVWGYIVPLVTVTAGFANFQAANNTAIVTCVEAGQRGVVSGLLNLSRNLGLITGASVMGAVFSVAVGTRNIEAANAGAVAAGTRTTFAVAAALVLAALMLALRYSSSRAGGRS